MTVSWPSLLRVAWRSLGQHKMRSSLTMLGIIIGVTSVIVMLGVGSGARAEVRSQVASLGSNFLIVMPGSQTRGGLSSGAGTQQTLTPEDALAVQKECPAVEYASAGVRVVGRVVVGNANWSTYLAGASANYSLVRNWPLASGEFFTEPDVRRAAKVVVLGQTIVRELFGGQDPVGQTVRIKGVPFRVIGVFSVKGQTAWGQDQDDLVVMPYTTCMKRVIGTTKIGVILVSARSDDLMDDATEQITTLIRQRHHIAPGEEDDFSVRSQREIAETFEATSKIMSVLLGAIASISLLVGGIGIMNIMLVSVTERTREIGIRLAVGARGRDILTQFLIEAVVLSSLGGVVALMLGWLGCTAIRSALGWPVQLSVPALVVAWGFAALVGVGFGLYPALKASQLNPIEALRYE